MKEPINDFKSKRRSKPKGGDGLRGKRWASAAALASVALLGGCLRFGPQEDEMANAVPREEEQKVQQNTDSAQNGETDENVREDVPQGTAENGGAEPESGDRTEDGSGGPSGEAEPESPEDGDEIQIVLSRDDPERTVEFDLQKLPSGYSLSGMSWEPEPAEAVENGTPQESAELSDEGQAGSEAPEGTEETEDAAAEPERVKTTYHDAVIAGEAGTDGFFVDRSGQRLGYRYAEEQTGESGTVRLEFRDEKGGITTWESRISLGYLEISDDAAEVEEP
ncbi:prolipoprotein diacylglyceryl transferase [Saccharibacillus alkalitolerans]|uniref:DUF4340 domain-containing protein n=1 Tax=Saccharibacillus alkalitolerans TaxID=2705290 RepID=A0ABX0FDF9_9BACL|nr:hypothetical protein [Saccharibacillus alkalitolerans]NGZ77778.1 hypothetical protein [Saccharibacillus alkalitolerans]